MAPERCLMVRLAQMAELVHDHVLEHRRRREDQAPVEVDPALGAAAAPQALLLLDPHCRRQQAVRPRVAIDIRKRVVLGRPFEPAREHALDRGLGVRA
jgi:hypothetical protein